METDDRPSAGSMLNVQMTSIQTPRAGPARRARFGFGENAPLARDGAGAKTASGWDDANYGGSLDPDRIKRSKNRPKQ